jgi:hypothetical protein
MAKLIPEKQIENEILNWLSSQGIFAWKNQSVGIYNPVRKSFMRRTNPHHIKGVSDILGILKDGRLLAIEVKAKYGKPSPEQILFIEKIKKNGGIAFIARSIQEVSEAFK